MTNRYYLNVPFGFNGAADFYRRKVNCQILSNSLNFCFNGAADFYRRKVGNFESCEIEDDVASMGPPIFIGGKTVDTPRCSIRSSASMGPPIFIGGKGR